MTEDAEFREISNNEAAALQTDPGGDESTFGKGDFTMDGRYIPYSGGTAGWFENSGVLKCELGNNYLFHTVLNSDEVRSKQFRRLGSDFNRRAGKERHDKKSIVRITFGKGKNKTSLEGGTKDISFHGMRLQFLVEVPLEKNDKFVVELMKYEGGEALVKLDAKLVWRERVGRIRPVLNMGISFTKVTGKNADALKAFIAD